jgi:hypothetical protein
MELLLMTIRDQLTFAIYTESGHIAFLREMAAGDLGDVRVLSVERIVESERRRT